MTAEDLPRRRRLTRASEIQAVLAGGTRRRTPRLEIIWCSNGQQHPRLGVITPRFGHTAVARNRLRRRIREQARRQLLPSMVSMDILIRARPPAYLASPVELAQDIARWRGTLAS